jgi:hypothetical protein
MQVPLRITIDVKDPASDSEEMPTSGRFGRDPPTRQRYPQQALFPAWVPAVHAGRADTATRTNVTPIRQPARNEPRSEPATFEWPPARRR